MRRKEEFWVGTKKLKRSTEVDDDGNKHGMDILYHDAKGNIKSSDTYVNGVKEGVCVEYEYNASPDSKGGYKARTSAKVLNRVEINYKRGAMHGKPIVFRYDYAVLNCDYVVCEFTEEGVLFSRSEYVGGKKHGEEVRYREDGETMLSKRIFEGGEMVGYISLRNVDGRRG